MNKIYGFGNALIDIEIKVSEEQLSEIKIEKGSMRHISKEDLDFLQKIAWKAYLEHKKQYN